MKILWLSKHEPLPIQEQALRELFGANVQILQDVNPFANAREVKRRYLARDYDDLVVVAPLWVIMRLTELGLRPLWAQMQEVESRTDAHITYRGRFLRFEGFRRIAGVGLQFADLTEVGPLGEEA